MHLIKTGSLPADFINLARLSHALNALFAQLLSVAKCLFGTVSFKSFHCVHMCGMLYYSIYLMAYWTLLYMNIILNCRRIGALPSVHCAATALGENLVVCLAVSALITPSLPLDGSASKR